jgi:hypothetical protein
MNEKTMAQVKTIEKKLQILSGKLDEALKKEEPHNQEVKECQNKKEVL